jgi:hypothetical protein
MPDATDAKLGNANTEARAAASHGRFVLVFAFYWVVFSVALYFAGHFLGDWRVRNLPGAMMTFTITPMLYVLGAQFMGLGLASVFCSALARRRWFNDFKQSAAYSKAEIYEGNSNCVMRVCGVIAMALGLIVLLSGINWYAQARSEALVVHPAFGFGEVAYRYADIERIHGIWLNGRYGRRLRYVVIFKSGTMWSTDSLPSDGDERKIALITLMSQKSGVPIQKDQQ